MGGGGRVVESNEGRGKWWRGEGVVEGGGTHLCSSLLVSVHIHGWSSLFMHIHFHSQVVAFIHGWWHLFAAFTFICGQSCSFMGSCAIGVVWWWWLVLVAIHSVIAWWRGGVVGCHKWIQWKTTDVIICHLVARSHLVESRNQSLYMSSYRCCSKLHIIRNF